MAREPAFLEAFTAISSGRGLASRPRCVDRRLPCTYAMNVRFVPVINVEVPALGRYRLFYVDHT